MNLGPLKKNSWFIIVGIIGIICLLAGSLWTNPRAQATLSPVSNSPSSNTASVSPATSSAAVADPATAYQNLYDQELTTMLDAMAGVNSVSVMVTLDSTETLTLARNDQTTTQRQQNGSSQSQSKTVDSQVFTQHNNDGSSTPVVVERLTPTVRGVLVMVSAADFYVAKAEIIDAIRNVLDVPAYKISVEPEKTNP